MKNFFFTISVFVSTVVSAQSVGDRMKLAWERFEKDSQMRAGIASLYVVNANSGAVVFERNSRIGLAPGSSQKVITAASAYEILGKDFRYTTQLRRTGQLRGDTLIGSLVVAGTGDPSFGSWRWKDTNSDSIIARMSRAVRGASIGLYLAWETELTGWTGEAIPDGWIWQDIGQYYGAGSHVLNWHENQFDLYTEAGSRQYEAVKVIRAVPDPTQPVVSAAAAGPPGSGDNSYLYPSIAGCNTMGGILRLRGTLPPGKPYTVAGALNDPSNTFWKTLRNELEKSRIRSIGLELPANATDPKSTKVLFEHRSPSLDSLMFWFLRKSINLYGEAFLKTMAFRQNGAAETAAGTTLLRSFWASKGIDAAELNIKDGSGLSPENRVSTHAQVQVLQYAKKQSWFPGFYLALPEYNGMKLKSGTIGGVKAYCGYHTSKAGITYTVSFIANNYNGSERELVQKMYAVLNVLK